MSDHPVRSSGGLRPADHLTATRQAYLRYLDEAVGRTDHALRTLAAAGPPPIDDGQQVADRVRIKVDDLRADLTEARDGLAAVDPNNPAAFGPVVAAATCWPRSANSAQAMGSIVADDRLRPAFDQAPACAALR